MVYYRLMQHVANGLHSHLTGLDSIPKITAADIY